MLQFFSRRLLEAAATMVLVTVVIFVAVRLVGDPTHLMLPPEAREEDRQVLREQLGISDPIIVQYGRYLANLARADFGESYRYQQPALKVVLERVGATALLTFTSLAIACLIGLPFGIMSAVWRETWIDYLGGIIATLGQSAPPFLLGLILLRIFAVDIGWFPSVGFGTFAHVILPSVALGWYSAAGIMRITRSSLTDVLDSEYIKMARIKGLPFRLVIGKHALRNATLPVVTFVGLQLGVLFGGAVSVEAIFSWPGMGQLILESIASLDYNVVQAAVLLLALTFIVINFSLDLLYGVIDPRIHHG